MWLQGLLPRHMRPDRVGYLLYVEAADPGTVMVAEGRKGALDTADGRSLLAHMRARAAVRFVNDAALGS